MANEWFPPNRRIFPKFHNLKEFHKKSRIYFREWQENQILIPDWTYFLGWRHKKKRFFTPREASFATLKGMQSADQRGKPPAIRQPFGLRFFMKIGLISFTFGALLEFAMIKSGFCMLPFPVPGFFTV